jgi:hypothetical protein
LDLRLVEDDLAAVMRQGIKSFTFDGLPTLPKFAVLYEVKPGRRYRDDDDLYLSANRLRRQIMAFLSERETIERLVGTALFAADPYTADLPVEVRQAEAGRRYNPSRPAKAGSIRKRPYGQQWKIIRKLAERLIALEIARHEQPEEDLSDWDTASSRPRWPRPRPPIPYHHLWEDRSGYRWLDHRTHLACSRDYSEITVTTDVHIEILHPGVRTYFHTFEPLSKRHPNVGASAPTVDFPRTDHPYAPVVHVGRVGASPRHPTWLLDYFDFGIGAITEEVLHIVFRHTYANPTRYRPWTVSVFAEFDNMDKLWITASCYDEDAAADPTTYTLQEYHPVAGTDYNLHLPRTASDDNRFLRNPADLEKTQDLMRRSQALMEQVDALETEYDSYFEYPEIEGD